MTTAYVDPTGNGTDNWAAGSYTNVNDAVRAPTAPTTTPQASQRIYAGAGGSLTNQITFYIAPIHDRRLTSFSFYQYRYTLGSVSTTLDITFDGIVLGDVTASGSSGGWLYWTWSPVAYDMSSAIYITLDFTGPVSIGKGDDETEWAGLYFEYTYEDRTDVRGELSASGTALAYDNTTTTTIDPNTVKNIDDSGEYIGAKFNPRIPQGDTVNNAVLVFVTSSDSEGEVAANGEDADDAADYTTAGNDVGGRTLTTANADFADSTIPGGCRWALDVTTIVQEIVDRAGWLQDNAMSFVLEGATHHTDDVNIDLSETVRLLIDSDNYYVGGANNYGIHNSRRGPGFGAEFSAPHWPKRLMLGPASTNGSEYGDGRPRRAIAYGTNATIDKIRAGYGKHDPVERRQYRGWLLNGTSDFLNLEEWLNLGVRELETTGANIVEDCQLSIFAWVNPTAISGTQTLWSVWDHADANKRSELAVNSSGQLTGSISNGTDTTVTLGTDGSTLTAGQWHHVGLTVNLASGRAQRWLDGKTCGTEDDLSSMTGMYINGSETVYNVLGCRHSGATVDSFFGGGVGPVGMFAFEVKAAQAWHLYRETSRRSVWFPSEEQTNILTAVIVPYIRPHVGDYRLTSKQQGLVR